KLGPISLMYKGSVEFLSKDPDTHSVVIKAAGKDARGNGTAAATVTVALTADGDSTVGTVETNLSITGKPAQFGRGLISEVGGKILNTFATCLSGKLASAPEETPAQAAAATEPTAESRAQSPAESPAESAVASAAGSMTSAVAAEHAEAVAAGRKAGEAAAASLPKNVQPDPVPEPETEAIDLLSYAGPSVLKRAAPLLALTAAVLAFITLRRRHR
ncbi:SRPBCC family protein, partial [Actinophytocola sp.]|uniref:SRPBCC family protein n=1 Tax=Actinophytocola sp. TaxID=1872138 RepID=UPI00389B1C29